MTNKRDEGYDRIIASSRDPYQTNEPDHLAYHELNRQRDHMSGQRHIRPGNYAGDIERIVSLLINGRRRVKKGGCQDLVILSLIGDEPVTQSRSYAIGIDRRQIRYDLGVTLSGVRVTRTPCTTSASTASRLIRSHCPDHDSPIYSTSGRTGT